jgi:hypothetical protein
VIVSTVVIVASCAVAVFPMCVMARGFVVGRLSVAGAVVEFFGFMPLARAEDNESDS